MHEEPPTAELEDEILGSQEPTHKLVADQDDSWGEDALAMAEMVGIELDPWQRQLLLDALGRRGDKWAAFEVVMEIARQNGKSVVLDIIALTALYVWRLPVIVYSAHEGLTAMKAFERLEALIKATPELRAETPDWCFKHANGKEKIKLPSGEEILFKTRTAGGGRGLSGDLVLMDEAQALKDAHTAALFPTLRARPDPLIFYAGSAGDQNSTVLGRLVRRIDNEEPRLTGYRFAGDEADDPADPRTWAKTNPALGRRIAVEYMAHEQRSMPPEKFAAELLCIGDYPREDGEEWVIPASSVEHTTDPLSTTMGPVVFALDAKPDQSWASIAAAGPAAIADEDDPGDRSLWAPRPGAGIHVEVVDHQEGVRWLLARTLQLLANHEHVGSVVIDPKGPLARLIPDFEDAGVTVHQTTAQEIADGCLWIYDAAVNEPRSLWHRGAPALISAIASASVRALAGGFAWKRQGKADISPLCAVTMAGYAAASWASKPATPPPSPRRVGARDSAAQGRQPRRRRAPDRSLATTGF